MVRPHSETTPKSPLVIPELNGALLESGPRLVASPNCSTTINALVAAPLHRAFGLSRMIAATYQAASGAGRDALLELDGESRAQLAGEAYAVEVFPEGLGFNFIPRIGEEGADGETDEERKFRDECGRARALG